MHLPSALLMGSITDELCQSKVHAVKHQGQSYCTDQTEAAAPMNPDSPKFKPVCHGAIRHAAWRSSPNVGGESAPEFLVCSPLGPSAAVAT